MVDILKVDLMDILDWDTNLRDFFVIPKKRPILVGLSTKMPDQPQSIPDFEEQSKMNFICMNLFLKQITKVDI